MIAFVLICCYLLILLTVALVGRIGFKRNSAVDYFLASRTCGSFLLVMTIFGTTMSRSPWSAAPTKLFAAASASTAKWRRGPA